MMHLETLARNLISILCQKLHPMTSRILKFQSRTVLRQDFLAQLGLVCLSAALVPGQYIRVLYIHNHIYVHINQQAFFHTNFLSSLDDCECVTEQENCAYSKDTFYGTVLNVSEYLIHLQGYSWPYDLLDPKYS